MGVEGPDVCIIVIGYQRSVKIGALARKVTLATICIRER